MKNLNIEALVALKKAVDNGEVLQKVEVRNVTSHIVEDYIERNKKHSDIKNFIENRINGICIVVSGGGKKSGKDEYDPIVVKTYKNNVKNLYSVIKMDGFYLEEANVAGMIYDDYLDMIINGSKYIENFQVSFYENVLNDVLNDTYLSECGFIADGGLAQIKDDRAYQIIDNIAAEVEGVLTILLPGEDDPSVVVVCKNKNVLISYDSFYIDMEETA